MVENIGIQKYDYRLNFIFKVYLANNEYAHMSVDNCNLSNAPRFVIIVDTEKFCRYAFNRRVPDNRVFDDASEEAKYSITEEFMRRSFEADKAVPMATVGYLSFKDTVTFEGGIKRTKWLVKHGAVCFPVECRDEECAKLIFDKVGYPGTTIQNERDLFK